MEADLLNSVTLLAGAGAASMIATSLLMLRLWRRVAAVQAIVASIVLLLALLPSLLHVVFGISTSTYWFTWYRIGSDSLIAVAEFWRAWVIYRLQQRPRMPR